MRLPVRGIYQVLEWQKGFNQQVHRLRGKVVGHFSMTTTWRDPKEKTGFFESYYYFWSTNLLGPKPVEKIADLVQKSADGQMIVGDRYGFPWEWDAVIIRIGVSCTERWLRSPLPSAMSMDSFHTTTITTVVPVSIATKPFEFT